MNHQPSIRPQGRPAPQKPVDPTAPMSRKERGRQLRAMVEAGLGAAAIGLRLGITAKAAARLASRAGISLDGGSRSARVAFWQDREICDIVARLAAESGLSRSALAQRAHSMVFGRIEVAREALGISAAPDKRRSNAAGRPAR